MIAPVAIAGILIIAMAAISSIKQAFAVGEESNNTGNEATSHESNNNGNEATSHESKNTGTALSAQGEEQQSKNTGKKPTELTLSVSPNGPAKTEENNETNETHTEVPVTISGRLTSEGSGVAGASIMIGMGEEEINTTDTDIGGNYSVATELPDHNSKHTIHAFTHTMPSDYNESRASTTIQLP